MSCGGIEKTVRIIQDIPYYVIPEGFTYTIYNGQVKVSPKEIMLLSSCQYYDGNQNWFTYMNVPNNYIEDDFENNQVSPPRKGSCAELNLKNHLGYNDWRLPTLEEVQAINYYVMYSGMDYVIHNYYAMLSSTTYSSAKEKFLHYYSLDYLVKGTISQELKSNVLGNSMSSIRAYCIRTK